MKYHCKTNRKPYVRTKKQWKPFVLHWYLIFEWFFFCFCCFCWFWLVFPKNPAAPGIFTKNHSKTAKAPKTIETPNKKEISVQNKWFPLLFGANVWFSICFALVFHFWTVFFIVFDVFAGFSSFFLNFPRSEFRSGVVGASPPVPSSSIFRYKSVIKNHYKCAPRSPSRLRGIFFWNPFLKIITHTPLGPFRVYEAFSFETFY